MNKARYWKSTYVVTVLTEGPHPPRYGNMHELANDICTGEAVGSYVDEAVEISRDEMEALLQEQHVDPTFLIHEGGHTSYTLEGRALTEAPEGREVARAPCIFCGRVIGHFNDGGDHHEDGDGVGWIVGAVVDGKPEEFLYCDQPPCAAVKNGGYDAIWRCGCVSDYVENVGDTCAACLCSRENAAPVPD